MCTAINDHILRVALAVLILLAVAGYSSPSEAQQYLYAQDAYSNTNLSGSGFSKISDVPYKDSLEDDYDSEKNVLDRYIPVGANDAPVLFFIHGGAWMTGDKSTTAHIGKTFAKKGILVVNVNYRLYPQVQYPDFVWDVTDAFAWTVNNIEQYGGNPERIFVAGHSAGAHLATLISTNERFLKSYGLSEQNIRGIIGISGPYYLHQLLFPEIYVNEKIRYDASPIFHVNADTPPTLLFYADKDINGIDLQAYLMSVALQMNNVPFDTIEIPNRDHGLILNRIGSRQDLVTKKISDFIQDN